MSLGSGAIVATARVLLAVDDSQLSHGISSARDTVAKGAGEMRTELSKLEETQLKAKLAQDSYTAAVARYGPESRQAQNALLRLSAAQRDVSETQQRMRKEMLASSGHFKLFGDHAHKAEHELSLLGRGGIAASGVFRGLGRSVAFASGAFLGAAGFTAVIKSSLGLAGDLQKELERSTVLFGANAGAVSDWSERTALSLGLARGEALKTANDFGSMLRGFGLLPRQAAGMSVSLTKLAADMAAFRGVGVDQISSALEGGLAGRGRGLKVFGIDLDNVRLKAEAVRLGLVKAAVDVTKVGEAQTAVAIAEAKLADAHKNYGAQSTQVAQATLTLHERQDALARLMAGKVPQSLDASQKAMAAYSVIVHDTALQHGFFAKHAANLQEREKQLHAELKNVEEEIGTALLPTVVKLLGHLATWIDRAQKTGQIQRDINVAVKDGTEIVHGIAGAFDALKGPVKDVVGALGGIKNMVEVLVGLRFASVLLGWTRGFRELANAEKAAAGAGAAGAAGRGLGGVAGFLARGAGALAAPPLILTLLQGGEKAPYVDKTGRQWTVDATTGTFYVGYPGKPRAQIRGDIPAEVRHYYGVDASAAPLGPSGFAGLRSPLQQKLVKTAAALGPGSGGVYVKGGAGASVSFDGAAHVAFDCSGYLHEIYRRNGISIPRSSEGQFYDPHAIKVPAGEEQPGDGVYFEAAGNGYTPPGHCGIYIGGGKFIEYYQSGRPARVSSLSERSDYWGARRWLKIRQSGAGGGGGGGDTSGASTGGGPGAGGSASGLHVEHHTHAKKTPVTLVPQSLQGDLTFARSTTGFADDITALNVIIQYLDKRIAKEKDVTVRKRLLDKLAQERVALQIAQYRRDSQTGAAAAIKAEKERIARVSAGGTATKDIYAGADPQKQADAELRVAIAEGHLASARKRYAANSQQVAQATLALNVARENLAKVESSKGKVIGKEFAGQPTIKFDPKTGKYITTVVKPDLDAMRAELKHILDKVLPKLDKEIKAAQEAITRLSKHAKKNRVTLAALRAKLASLKKERTEFIKLAHDLAISINDLGQAIALTPDPEQGGTDAIPAIPTDTTPGSSSASSALSAQQTQQQLDQLVDQNVAAYFGGLRDLTQSYASNVIAAALQGRLGGPPLLTGSSPGTMLTVQNFFQQGPSDPHLFTASLEFELKALMG